MQWMDVESWAVEGGSQLGNSFHFHKIILQVLIDLNLVMILEYVHTKFKNLKFNRY